MGFPTAGTFNVPATPGDFTAEEAASAFENWLAATKNLPGGKARTEKTISAGVIVVDGPTHTVDTEADAAADDLTNLQYTSGGVETLPDGSLLILWPENAGRSVTLRNMAGGVGQICTLSGLATVLNVPFVLQRIGSVWYEIVHGRWVTSADDVQTRLETMSQWIVGMTGGLNTGYLASGSTGYAALQATETSPPTLAVNVAGGLWAVSGVLCSRIAATTTSAMTPPSAAPRKDLVSIAPTGDVVVTPGTESQSPSRPATPASHFPIAEIYHRVGETSVKNANDGVNGYISADLRIPLN